MYVCVCVCVCWSVLRLNCDPFFSVCLFVCFNLKVTTSISIDIVDVVEYGGYIIWGQNFGQIFFVSSRLPRQKKNLFDSL